MGGCRATGDRSKGLLTQAWLAAGTDARADVSGGYFFHQKPKAASGAARDPDRQDAAIAECERLSGVAMPAA